MLLVSCLHHTYADVRVIVPCPGAEQRTQSFPDVYLYSLSTVAAEMLVIAVTLTKTLQQLRLTRGLRMERSPLILCLVHNGNDTSLFIRTASH